MLHSKISIQFVLLLSAATFFQVTALPLPTPYPQWVVHVPWSSIIVWLFHFNRSGSSDSTVLWVLVVIYVHFSSFSRISELQSDDGDKKCRVCYYYMFNDYLRVDISITHCRDEHPSSPLHESRLKWGGHGRSGSHSESRPWVLYHVYLRPFHGYSSHNFSLSQGGPSGHASPIPSQKEGRSDSYSLPDLNSTPSPPSSPLPESHGSHSRP
jgi:hypothetical protein